MKFGHIELFVKNTETSKDFLCNVLGFKLEANQGINKWVKLGNLEILLREGHGSDAGTYQTAESGIIFYTSDLKTKSKELEKRGIIFKGTDLSDNCSTFTDLDGHWFQLVDPNH